MVLHRPVESTRLTGNLGPSTADDCFPKYSQGVVFGHSRSLMPASYVIDKQRRLVISTATGVVTAEECKQHQDRLVNDPDFHPTFNQILDFTGATTIGLNYEILRFLAVRHVFRTPSRRAILPNNEEF